VEAKSTAATDSTTATKAVLPAASSSGSMSPGFPRDPQPSTAVASAATSTTDSAAATPASQVLTATGNAQEALDKAASANKYLFAFFWKAADEPSAAMRRVFDEALAEISAKADTVAVNVTDASQKEFIEKYGLDNAPMPLVLAFAPNGAITGGFPTQVEKQQLLDAFVSPCMAQCMKALQESKLVLLCVQNENTASSGEAMKGVQDFKDDERYASATEIVMLDPSKADESAFLGDLKIAPDTKTAVTVLMAPPGAAVGMVEGPTTKQIFQEFLSRASACGPGGCGPGGCGPKAK
jgi:hypothetical protein